MRGRGVWQSDSSKHPQQKQSKGHGYPPLYGLLGCVIKQNLSIQNLLSYSVKGFYGSLYKKCKDNTSFSHAYTTLVLTLYNVY